MRDELYKKGKQVMRNTTTKDKTNNWYTLSHTLYYEGMEKLMLSIMVRDIKIKRTGTKAWLGLRPRPPPSDNAQPAFT